MSDQQLLYLPHYLSAHLDVVWTLILLGTRFTALLSLLPGLGMGERGLAVRAPAIFVFSCASLAGSKMAAIPENLVLMIVSVIGEAMLGLGLAVIPYLIVVGVQISAQLASGSMGLSASNLIDPTSGAQVSDIGRLQGDLTTLFFLVLGGQHVVVRAASGMGGEFVPGSFIVGPISTWLLISLVGHIFEVGVMLSMPVVVALLLTQFVMGLIARAVPTVNVFIIAFPVTITIGLILTAITIPEIMVFLENEFQGVEGSILELLRDTGLAA